MDSVQVLKIHSLFLIDSARTTLQAAARALRILTFVFRKVTTMDLQVHAFVAGYLEKLQISRLEPEIACFARIVFK